VTVCAACSGAVICVVGTQAASGSSSRMAYSETLPRSGPCDARASCANLVAVAVQHRIHTLAPLNQPASVHRADQIKPASTRRSGDDLIPLIVRCLESQGSSFTAAVTGATCCRLPWCLHPSLRFLPSWEPTKLCLHIAGSVDHFQSEPSDAGWGCGYRNIQMLVSNLLKREV
jgi:Peptidase family C78